MKHRFATGWLVAAAVTVASGQSTTQFIPTIPKAWDADALASMTPPLRAKHRLFIRLSPMRITRRASFDCPKAIPVYGVGREPAGYLDSIRRNGSEYVEVDPAKFTTEQEWIEWGAQLFGGALEGGAPELVADL